MKVERRVISGQVSRHALQGLGVGVLEGDVQIGQDQPLGHQGDQVAHMGVGVDVMQTHPRPERAQITGQIGDMGAVAALFGMFDVNAVGRGVLADDQEFPDAVRHQPLCLAQDGMGGARLQPATHVRDDAELALVVATLEILR